MQLCIVFAFFAVFTARYVQGHWMNEYEFYEMDMTIPDNSWVRGSNFAASRFWGTSGWYKKITWLRSVSAADPIELNYTIEKTGANCIFKRCFTQISRGTGHLCANTAVHNQDASMIGLLRLLLGHENACPISAGDTDVSDVSFPIITDFYWNFSFDAKSYHRILFKIVDTSKSDENILVSGQLLAYKAD